MVTRSSVLFGHVACFFAFNFSMSLGVIVSSVFVEFNDFWVAQFLFDIDCTRLMHG